MPQFNLTWFNTAVIINPNSISQRALYRQKSVGGSFTSTGFTPTNDLPKYASATTSPVLAANVVWEFKVQAICTVGGPTDNDNGIIEQLKFACISPVLGKTTTTATITINLAGTDITKARFTLHKQSDNSVISGPTIVNKSGTSVTLTVTGLTPDTTYYWSTEFYATVGGIEILSSASNQLNASCQSANFDTDEDVCLPITAITVSSIEL